AFGAGAQARTDRNLLAALDLARAEIPILPAIITPDGNGGWIKKPARKGWQKGATTNQAKVRGLWRVFPNSVPAIATGEAGLIVIDADRHHPDADGITALDALVDGQEWPLHPVTITAGGGRHHFFLQPLHRPALGNATGK